MGDYSTTRRAFVTGLLATAAGCSSLGDNREFVERTPTEQPRTPTPETETTTEGTETTTPENHPGTFLVDFTPAIDQQVRQQLQENVEEIKNETTAGKPEKQVWINAFSQWYTERGIPQEKASSIAEEQVNGILERATPEFSEPSSNELTESYNTEETYDDIAYDESAFEHWHDNDYLNLAWAEKEDLEMTAFVENIPNEEMWPRARNTAEFHPENFLDTGPDTDQFIDAYREIQDFLVRYERYYTRDNSSIENRQYAAMFQEAFDRYTDFETHFWHVATQGHGMGMVWNQQEDTIRMMETVNSNIDNPEQYTAKVENSVYTTGDTGWWHPIRFAEEYRNDSLNTNVVSFEKAKGLAAGMLGGISGGYEGADLGLETSHVAYTTGYVLDIVDSIRNYNSNDIDFSQLEQQSKALNKTVRKAAEEDQYYVLGGTVDDFYTLQVEDQEIIQAVDNDKERRYDNINKVAEHTDQIDGPITLDDINNILDNSTSTAAS